MVQADKPPGSIVDTADRKRPHTVPITVTSSAKRSKVAGSAGPTNVLSLSGAECEEIEDLKEAVGGPVPVPSYSSSEQYSPIPSNVTNGLNDSCHSRSHSPANLISEAEMDRKVCGYYLSLYIPVK